VQPLANTAILAVAASHRHGHRPTLTAGVPPRPLLHAPAGAKECRRELYADGAAGARIRGRDQSPGPIDCCGGHKRSLGDETIAAQPSQSTSSAAADGSVRPT